LTTKKNEDVSIERQILKLVKKENPENIEKLLKLAKEKLSLTDEEALKHIMRLINQEKIRLKQPQKPTPQSLEMARARNSHNSLHNTRKLLPHSLHTLRFRLHIRPMASRLHLDKSPFPIKKGNGHNRKGSPKHRPKPSHCPNSRPTTKLHALGHKANTNNPKPTSTHINLRHSSPNPRTPSQNKRKPKQHVNDQR
jgi:hypothetical protein